MILDAAVTYFAEHGFEAELRSLAKQINVSVSLIIRYFPTKDALLDAVYEVFHSKWNPGWADLLRDRSIPLPDRLVIFYSSYLDALDDPFWIKLSLRSSLDGQNLARRFIAEHLQGLLHLIVGEIRAWKGIRNQGAPTEREIENVWHMQSSAIYYLIRKHVYGTPIMSDRTAFCLSIAKLGLQDTAPVDKTAKNKRSTGSLAKARA